MFLVEAGLDTIQIRHKIIFKKILGFMEGLLATGYANVFLIEIYVFGFFG